MAMSKTFYKHFRYDESVMQSKTVNNIVTPKGNQIDKTFRVDSREDLNYITGYIQACKDRGAKVVFKDNNLTEALPV